MPTPSQARVLPVTLLSCEPIAPGFMVHTMACEDLARTIRPGQFFNIAVPGDSTQLLRVPFSYVSADPSAGTVTFAYRIVGDATRRLASLPAGTRTDLLGPAGNGWRVDGTERAALLVGGGSGMAPIVALAELLRSHGAEVDVIEGAQTSRALVFERELLGCGVRSFNAATDDGSRGHRGFPTDVMADMLARGAYDHVYTCGPRPMMAGIARLAAQADLPCQCSMESGMGCGFGACATCAIDTVSGKQSVCMNGPVFDAREVVW